MSIRGCRTASESKSIANRSLQLAEQSHLESIAPKISITDLNLSRLNNALQDIAVFSYQLHNAGTLTMNDVHSQINYDVTNLSGKSVDGSLNTGSGDTVQIGGTLVSGDHLDKTYLLIGIPDKKGHVVVTFKALTHGLQIPTVRISSQFTDFEGRRVLSCDEFTYQWITQRFERNGVCVAWDIPTQFRDVTHSGLKVVPMPAPGMRMP